MLSAIGIGGVFGLKLDCTLFGDVNDRKSLMSNKRTRMVDAIKAGLAQRFRRRASFAPGGFGSDGVAMSGSSSSDKANSLFLGTTRMLNQDRI